jgi:hypothetical protein
MNTPESFNGDRFYNYTLPGILLVWLALVLTLGSLWGG